jgi:hypothetical protein
MAQYARPDGDTDTSIYWGSGPYWPNIDEVTPNDSDLCRCGGNGSGTIEVSLSELADPLSSTGHTFRFRAWQQDHANQRTLAVYLVQGTTVKATYAAFNLVKGTATAYELTLSAAEADSISDYNDLRLRFTSGGDTSWPTEERSEVYVSWAELEVPTPADSATRVIHRTIEVAFATSTAPILVAARTIEIAWKVSTTPVLVSARVIEVAWTAPSLLAEVTSHLIEVAYLRAGRIYRVAIGHF